MKKILSLFATLTLATSASSSVVSCNSKKNRFTDPTIADKFKNKIISELNGDQFSYKYKFDDIFKSQKSSLTTLAVRLIDQLTSKQFYTSNEKLFAEWAGVSDSDRSKIKFDNQFYNWVKSLTEEQVYTDYINKYTNGYAYLEDDAMSKSYNVLGIGTTGTSTWDATKNYAQLKNVDVKYSTNEKKVTMSFWQIPGISYTNAENPDTNNHIKLGKDTIYQGNQINIPILEDGVRKNIILTSDKFKELLTNGSAKGLVDGVSYTISPGLAGIKKLIYRGMAQYATFVTLPKILDKLISETYLQTTLLHRNYNGSQANSDIFVTKNSGLLNLMQTWNTSTTSKLLTSNFKMVWEFKTPILDTNGTTNLENKMNTYIGQKKSEINNQSWTPTKFKDFLSNSTITNLNNNGNDPIFGINHFKGFAAYNGGSLLNSLALDDTYKSKIAAVNQTGFVQNGQPGKYGFEDTNKKYAYFVFVLPIFAQDILNNQSITFDNSKTKKIVLKDYYSGDSGQGLDLSWAGLNLAGRQGVKYISDIKNQIGSKYESSLGTFAVNKSGSAIKTYDDKGALNQNIDTTQTSLLRWAEYSFSGASTVSDAAKTRLYSIVFNYNKKNIYAQNLYDQIGKYIKDDN